MVLQRIYIGHILHTRHGRAPQQKQVSSFRETYPIDPFWRRAIPAETSEQLLCCLITCCTGANVFNVKGVHIDELKDEVPFAGDIWQAEHDGFGA